MYGQCIDIQVPVVALYIGTDLKMLDLCMGISKNIFSHQESTRVSRKVRRGLWAK